MRDYGKVSVVMPCYNASDYIEEAINSVLNQTYPDVELIIVDDCSTDDSVDKVKGFGDKRIRLIENAQNSGAAVSRNKAIEAATGRWIAFLDADDVWDNSKLEKQLEYLMANNAHFGCCWYFQMDSAGRKSSVVKGPRIIGRRRLLRCCYIGCLTAIYDREVVGSINVDPRIRKRNDYAMWLSVIKKTKVCLMYPEALASYRRHEGSISSGSGLKLLKWQANLFRIQEGKNWICAWLMAFRSVLYTFLKKAFYVKRVK